MKVSRIIKRRTMAKEACDAGHVYVNGRQAKAGTDLNIGDDVVIHFGGSDMHFSIKDVRETVRKEDAETMYEIIS